MPAPNNTPGSSTEGTPPATSTETPVTKSEIQDDVQWLEERLEKQDLTMAEIKAQLAILTAQKESTPELFNKKAVEILESIQQSLSQRANRKPSQTTTSQSTLPVSEQTAQNQSGEGAPVRTQDSSAAPDKSVLRFRRKAI